MAIKIDWSLSLSILIPALLTVAGWYLGSYFESKRDMTINLEI
jgi:hypothetical protein